MFNLFKFKNVVLFSSIIIASCAAFFSVIGIAGLFAGAKISSIVMASFLELGKLVSTSYLFRFWKQSNFILKTYLMLSVLVLMLITSIGIFGYLSAAYQHSSGKNEILQQKISLVTSEKTQKESEIKMAEQRISSINEMRTNQEKRLSDAMTNGLIVRNPIQFQELNQQTIDLIQSGEKNIENEYSKIKNTREQIQNINDELNKLKMSSLENVDIVTFSYFSKEFNMSMDKLVKWFIVLLIVVFDPLAICLLISYNNILRNESPVSQIEGTNDSKSRSLKSNQENANFY